MTRSGACLCGAITLSAEISPELGACHCGQCRKWSGGGPLIVAHASELEIKGGENIAAYHASDWGERAFCKTCGTTLYWRMQGKPVANVSVGLFDDQTGLQLTEEIFVDSRPDWHPPVTGAAQSSEADEMAKLAAYQAKNGEST